MAKTFRDFVRDYISYMDGCHMHNYILANHVFRFLPASTHYSFDDKQFYFEFGIPEPRSSFSLSYKRG